MDDRKCQSCKWYWDKECHSKEFKESLNIMVDNDFLEEFIDNNKDFLNEKTIEKLSDFKAVIEIDPEFSCKYWE